MTTLVHYISCNIIQDIMNDLPINTLLDPVLRCILVSVVMVLMVLW